MWCVLPLLFERTEWLRLKDERLSDGNPCFCILRGYADLDLKEASLDGDIVRVGVGVEPHRGTPIPTFFPGVSLVYSHEQRGVKSSS